jgi:pyrroline-5-carboxylate reductase
MAKQIGFIGAGNMGSALIKGFLSQRAVEPENVYACDKDEEKVKKLSEETGVHYTLNSLELLDEVEVLFIAVKPQDVEHLLAQIGSKIKNILLVSVAAGIPTSYIEARAPEARVIRVMPNMPAAVYEMAAAYSLGASATKDDEAVLEELLKKTGICYKVDEGLMDSVTGLSGSGPAYAYYIIKALAEGGVQQGLPEDVALNLAVQTVKGAAVMVENTHKTPQQLIDEVTSPGGTTIEGLKVLDEYKVNEALKKAVDAATQKSRELSK